MASFWHWPAAILRLARHLRETPTDIAVLHGQWAGPLGTLAAKLAGTPHSIYIAHCPAFYHSTTLFRAIRNYIAEKIPCRLASYVVSLSHGNYYNYLFRGWAPESRLVQIPNGVDLTSTPPDSASFRREHGFDPAARHCVYVGRLDDQKRPDWLMEGWALAQLQRPAEASPWLLWVVGDGEERASCEAAAGRLGIEKTVRFVGAQPEGLPWINAADLVVMTSLYEGHALVPLEAMACSRAIVAFYTDGIVDSVQHEETGLLPELGDFTGLGRSIARLLGNDAERTAFGRNGRRFVTENFPLSKTVAAYQSLLHRLLAESNSDKKTPLATH